MNEIAGYGDSECHRCKIALNPPYRRICLAMVGYTRLQIQAAEDGKWDSAIVAEGLQNDLATLLNDVDIDGQKGNCIPGFKRM